MKNRNNMTPGKTIRSASIILLFSLVGLTDNAILIKMSLWFIVIAFIISAILDSDEEEELRKEEQRKHEEWLKEWKEITKDWYKQTTNEVEQNKPDQPIE